MKSSLVLNYMSGYNDNKFQFAMLKFWLYKNISFLFTFNHISFIYVISKMWWHNFFFYQLSQWKLNSFFFFFFDTNCKITELSASPIIQISLWEKHACFILLCLLSINTLYLGKLNHNSFSLFLLFLLMLRGLCW